MPAAWSPARQVLFGGITAGRVAAVRAWNEDPTKIELLLEVKEGTPLNASCTARLGAVSLMSSPRHFDIDGEQRCAASEAGRGDPI